MREHEKSQHHDDEIQWPDPEDTPDVKSFDADAGLFFFKQQQISDQVAAQDKKDGHAKLPEVAAERFRPERPDLKIALEQLQVVQDHQEGCNEPYAIESGKIYSADAHYRRDAVIALFSNARPSGSLLS